MVFYNLGFISLAQFFLFFRAMKRKCSSGSCSVAKRAWPPSVISTMIRSNDQEKEGLMDFHELRAQWLESELTELEALEGFQNVRYRELLRIMEIEVDDLCNELTKLERVAHDQPRVTRHSAFHKLKQKVEACKVRNIRRVNLLSKLVL